MSLFDFFWLAKFVFLMVSKSNRHNHAIVQAPLKKSVAFAGAVEVHNSCTLVAVKVWHQVLTVIYMALQLHLWRGRGAARVRSHTKSDISGVGTFRLAARRERCRTEQGAFLQNHMPEKSNIWLMSMPKGSRRCFWKKRLVQRDYRCNARAPSFGLCLLVWFGFNRIPISDIYAVGSEMGV